NVGTTLAQLPPQFLDSVSFRNRLRWHSITQANDIDTCVGDGQSGPSGEGPNHRAYNREPARFQCFIPTPVLQRIDIYWPGRSHPELFHTRQQAAYGFGHPLIKRAVRSAVNGGFRAAIRWR